MESQHHLIIAGSAVYPDYDVDGKETGSVKCLIFDRCWCVREIAIRDCIAIKVLKHQKSQIIFLDEYLEEIASSAQSGKPIFVEIAQLFREKDFFADLKGRPEDLKAIRTTLFSPGFFKSPQDFNEYNRKRMILLFTECLPQVSQLLIRYYCVFSLSHGKGS
jgi:hypothetical protein